MTKNVDNNGGAVPAAGIGESPADSPGNGVDGILAELAGISDDVISGKTSLDESLFSTRPEAQRLKEACGKADVHAVLAHLRSFTGDSRAREFIARIEASTSQKDMGDGCSHAPAMEATDGQDGIGRDGSMHDGAPVPAKCEAVPTKRPNPGSQTAAGHGRKKKPSDNYALPEAHGGGGDKPVPDACRKEELPEPAAGKKARLTVRCAKDGKYYLRSSALAEYTGRPDILGELGMAGLMRRKEFEGYKIRMPTSLLKDKKLGRVMWLEHGGAGPEGSFHESTPEFCFSSAGLKELERLLRFRRGTASGKDSGGDI